MTFEQRFERTWEKSNSKPCRCLGENVPGRGKSKHEAPKQNAVQVLGLVRGPGYMEHNKRWVNMRKWARRHNESHRDGKIWLDSRWILRVELICLIEKEMSKVLACALERWLEFNWNGENYMWTKSEGWTLW